MHRSRRGARAPSLIASSCLLFGSVAALAQEPLALPDIVVTPDRIAEPIQRSGSAVSVITRERIETFNPASIADALRDVPGVDVTEAGGPGSATTIRIRGANAGQTLVLIDGVRANDAAGTSGEFDFSNLPPTSIERIEVLRGPQTALYGSDAIGGVVNVITRKGGQGGPHVEVRTEGGSYGTLGSSGTVWGGSGPWSYAFSTAEQISSGFSRYGYRIGRLERANPPFEADSLSRESTHARLGYDAGEGVRLDFGALSVRTLSQYDAAFGAFPDTPSKTRAQLSQIWGRATVEQGPLTHSLQVYFNETDRKLSDVSYFGSLLPKDTYFSRYEYQSGRLGAEYQGNLKLQKLGALIFGGKIEREAAQTFSTSYTPFAAPRSKDVDAEQRTRAVFALWQLPIGERLIVTLGGRHDEVNAESFDTWRTTAAYTITETGTKLRASAGTGGKAPTLYQLYAPFYGNADLSPERSIGWDAGFDQSLFDGRMTLSGTYFENSFRRLIDFDTATFRYFNVARAETSGIEIEGRYELVPGFLRLTGNYTHLRAVDRDTGLTLARRPHDAGRIGLQVQATPQWAIEPRVTLVSQRFSSPGETDRLAPYARFDLYSEYRLDANWKVFGRIENITDARYQDVLNYGTTGRAFYGGASFTW